MAIDLAAVAPPLPLLLQTDAFGNLIQDQPTIRARMASLLPTDESYVPGDFLDDSLGIYSIEEVQAIQALIYEYRSTFMQYAECIGIKAILRAAEKGVNINSATVASYLETFNAPAGTVIPAGTRLSTASTVASQAVGFTVTTTTTVPVGQTSVLVPIQCTQSGATGNVTTGAISLLLDPIAGVTSVTNDSTSQVTIGVDQESIASLKSRYFDAIQNPGTSGNGNFFRQAARAVSGVGNAIATRTWNGPGTVLIQLLDTNGTPGASAIASDAMVEAVENAIIDPWRLYFDAATLTLGGFGVTTDTSQTAAKAAGHTTARMAYSASGVGTIVQSRIDLLLNGEPGIWMCRPILDTVGSVGAGNLFQFLIYNVTQAATAGTTSAGGTASKTLTHADIPNGSNSFPEPYQAPSQDFWWNGTDQLELRITRLAADTTSVVYVDQVLYQSSMSRDDRNVGLQNLADRVTVVPATAVPLTISLHPIVQAGYVTATVEAAILASVQAYLASIAFNPSVSVASYGQIGAHTLVDTVTGKPIPGMLGYSSYTLNGGSSDVAIARGDVATLAGNTITFT